MVWISKKRGKKERKKAQCSFVQQITKLLFTYVRAWGNKLNFSYWFWSILSMLLFSRVEHIKLTCQKQTQYISDVLTNSKSLWFKFIGHGHQVKKNWVQKRLKSSLDAKVGCNLQWQLEYNWVTFPDLLHLGIYPAKHSSVFSNLCSLMKTVLNVKYMVKCFAGVACKFYNVLRTKF